ncbi:MAG: MFS transporter [Flavobacteriales bacterium]|nr:MFS transporter [Flavobacteriales bacterium]|tara:strand:+ start:15549 stop:16934 length:1386 start_codon:yes stop_codon:yes gene_type:complete
MQIKPKLRFWQIWNMSFGFLGIQFGYALQGGFMSRIFETLGADEHSLPLLWIAAPLTGLIVQPIIGQMSDNTWHVRYGRRRPYFLIGAILASLTLLVVPHSSALWMAAGALWILDASMNISMEPFRALVADKLPDSQRSFGFVVQTLIIGVSTWVASNLPLMVSSFGVSNEAEPGVIPMSVQVAFGIGAAVFILSILYTVFTTDEYPPEDIEAFRKEQIEKSGFRNTLREVFKNIAEMPTTMKRLGVVQFFSWFAFFCMWSMANPALTDHIFNAAKPEAIDFAVSTSEQIQNYQIDDRAFNEASNKVGSFMGNYGLSSMVFALLLTVWTAKRRINRKLVHMFSLLIGGIGFISMYLIDNPTMLILSFVCIGFSWGSILSMPYAMLSSTLDPKRMGVYMGIFNMFIVLPQIVAATSLTIIYQGVFGEEPINAMLLAGTSLIIASASNFLIKNKKAVSYIPEG